MMAKPKKSISSQTFWRTFLTILRDLPLGSVTFIPVQSKSLLRVEMEKNKIR
jgi:hypothetical protein